ACAEVAPLIGDEIAFVDCASRAGERSQWFAEADRRLERLQLPRTVEELAEEDIERRRAIVGYGRLDTHIVLPGLENVVGHQVNRQVGVVRRWRKREAEPGHN